MRRTFGFGLAALTVLTVSNCVLLPASAANAPGQAGSSNSARPVTNVSTPASAASTASPTLRPAPVQNTPDSALRQAPESTDAANLRHARQAEAATSEAPAFDAAGNPLHPIPGIITPATPKTNLTQMTPQGLMSESRGHSNHGVLTRALGGAAADVGHATLGLLTSVVFNQSVDLPPDDASKPDWPFNEPHRKAMYYIAWADGTTAKISRLPDGSLQILGSGKRYVLQPESDGSFALFGDFGSMASVTPRPGGGYTIMKADGTQEQILPREGGGFVVTGKGGIVATILPGVNGSKHIRGSGYSSGFMQ